MLPQPLVRSPRLLVDSLQPTGIVFLFDIFYKSTRIVSSSLLCRLHGEDRFDINWPHMEVRLAEAGAIAGAEDMNDLTMVEEDMDDIHRNLPIHLMLSYHVICSNAQLAITPSLPVILLNEPRPFCVHPGNLSFRTDVEETIVFTHITMFVACDVIDANFINAAIVIVIAIVMAAVVMIVLDVVAYVPAISTVEAAKPKVARVPFQTLGDLTLTS